MTGENDTPSPFSPPRLAVLHEPLSAVYREALGATRGLQSSRASFRIDRHGYSPELAKDLGASYLDNEASGRFALFVTPDQIEAPLLRERFSYESGLFDLVLSSFSGCFPALCGSGAWFAAEAVSRPGVPRTLEELSAVESVACRLRSSGEWMQELFELFEMSERLGLGENLLDDSFVEDMVARARRLQSLLGPLEDLRAPPAESPVTSFTTPAVGGVYLLRTEEQELLLYPPPYRRPDVAGYQGLARVVPFSSPELVPLLLEYGFATPAPEQAQDRKSQIEDEILLSRGLSPDTLDSRMRQEALADCRNVLPRAWKELAAVASTYHHRGPGAPAPDAAATLAPLSPEVKVKLVAPGRDAAVVARLLAELDPLDHTRCHRYHRDRFWQAFQDFPPLKQQYVLRRLGHPPPDLPESVHTGEDDRGGSKEEIVFIDE